MAYKAYLTAEQEDELTEYFISQMLKEEEAEVAASPRVIQRMWRV